MNVDRDTSITVCGLLNNIISSGDYKPEEWAEMTMKAYNVHQQVCRAVMQAKERK